VNLPTAVTVLRIVLIPIFGWLWARGRHEAALWAFAVAASSDLLDGFLARALDQRTRLGAILDPAADKLMLLVSFLVGASVGAVPWWLAGLVIGRDLFVSAGTATLALLLRSRLEVNRIRPTRIGKYTTVFEAVTIGLSLLASTRHASALRPWLAPLVLATGAFSVVSAAQYAGRGVLLFVEHRARPGRELHGTAR
jgi:cardiolipin synthase